MVKSRNGLTGDFSTPVSIKKHNDWTWRKATGSRVNPKMMIKVIREDFILNPGKEEKIIEDKSYIDDKILRLSGVDFNKGYGWDEVNFILNWSDKKEYNEIIKRLKESPYIEQNDKIEWYKKIYDTDRFRSDSNPEYASKEKISIFFEELNVFLNDKETEGIKYDKVETIVTIPPQYTRAGVDGWIESEIYNNALINDIRRDFIPESTDKRTINSEDETVLVDRTPEEQKVQLTLSAMTKEQLNTIKSEVYRYFAIPDFVSLILPDVWVEYNSNNQELDETKWITYEQLAFVDMQVNETLEDRDKIYKIIITFEKRSRHKIKERFSYLDINDLELDTEKNRYYGVVNENNDSSASNEFMAAIRVTKKDLYKIAMGNNALTNTDINYNYPWYDKDVDEYIMIFDPDDEALYKIEVTDAKVALQSYIYYKENGRDTNIDNTIADVSKYAEKLYNDYIYRRSYGKPSINYDLQNNTYVKISNPILPTEGKVFAMREREMIW